MADTDDKDQGKQGGDGGGGQSDIAKLEAKNRELLGERKKDAQKIKDLETQVAGFGELKGKFDKLAEIAKALGAPDPAAEDPAKVKAQLEAEARAKREKSDKVKDALTMALLGTGRKFTPDAVRMIHRGAEDHPSIGFDDTGAVTGIDPYLESVFGLFGGVADDGTKKAGSPPPPGKPGGSGGPVPKRYSTIAELDAEGPQAVIEYQLKHPEDYAALQAAHSATLLKPRRQMMPSPAAPQR